MLSRLNQRENNVDASLDSTGRTQQFQSKRQIVKLARTKPAAASEKVYARIRWNVTAAGGDLTEGQLVDKVGADLSPAAYIFIDTPASIGPVLFGAAFYEVVPAESATTATRTGASTSPSTRDLYVATRYVGSGTIQDEIEIVDATYGYAKPRAAAADIETSLGGADYGNVINAVGCKAYTLTHTAFSPSAGWRMDAYRSLIWTPSGSKAEAVCDHLQLGRTRAGHQMQIVANQGAFNGMVFTASIDPGEEFHIDVFSAHGTNAVPTANTSANLARMRFLSNGTTQPACVGYVSGARGITTVSSQVKVDLTGNSGTGPVTAQLQYNNTFFNLTPSFTITNGRITTVTITEVNIGAAGDFGQVFAILRGGRSDFYGEKY